MKAEARDLVRRPWAGQADGKACKVVGSLVMDGRHGTKARGGGKARSGSSEARAGGEAARLDRTQNMSCK